MNLYIPDIGHVLHNLQKCHCCRRHQFKKTKSYWQFINENVMEEIENLNPESNIERISHAQCNCPCICRQMIRWFYRCHRNAVNH